MYIIYPIDNMPVNSLVKLEPKQKYRVLDCTTGESKIIASSTLQKRIKANPSAFSNIVSTKEFRVVTSTIGTDVQKGKISINEGMIVKNTFSGSFNYMYIPMLVVNARYVDTFTSAHVVLCGNRGKAIYWYENPVPFDLKIDLNIEQSASLKCDLKVWEYRGEHSGGNVDISTFELSDKGFKVNDKVAQPYTESWISKQLMVCDFSDILHNCPSYWRDKIKW